MELGAGSCWTERVRGVRREIWEFKVLPEVSEVVGCRNG